MAGLGLLAGELGVDRFVGERAGIGVVDTAQEVGDAANPSVHERHLEHDVVAFGKHVADWLKEVKDDIAANPDDPFGHLSLAQVISELGHTQQALDTVETESPKDCASLRMDMATLSKNGFVDSF